MFDWVSAIAALVSVVAAVYARWQAKAAERQNEIALHNERLRLYHATLHFGSTLAGKGPRISDEDAWKFRESAELAEFYFDEPLYKKLSVIFDDALQLLTKNDQWGEAKEAGDSTAASKLNKERYSLAQALRDQCFVTADSMKPKLRVGRS
jgi:hypothetical protein